MTLDPATRSVYRRTDSATLLSLLPEIRRLLKTAQKERERIEQSQPAESVDDEKLAADLHVYIVAATARELWIRDELKRRGLLPLWPGEEQHLNGDD
ncbi:MAG: hypothetical protein ABJD68_17840 [Nakamurella sp.]